MYTQISDIIGFFGNLIYGRTVEGELVTRNPAGHSMLADVELDEAAGHPLGAQTLYGICRPALRRIS